MEGAEMLSQTVRTTGLTLDGETLEAVAAQPEAPLSDAPVPSPEGGGIGLLLLGLLLSPKEPKDPNRR
ncbi:hypothetical protein ABZ840_07175 [Streptomyces sp. NPDC047117]|uniref:hypothetical protein n=1 Tax=unclassified Streptomyces TaxID=2593676 RepID=UPI0033C76FDD